MRVFLGLALVVALVGGVVLLRSATMAVDEPTPEGSRTEVVVEAEVVREDVHPPLNLARSLILLCETDVHTPLTGPVRVVSTEDDGTFAFTFSPALSESEETRLHGCLQDATVDHLLLDVVRMERIDAPA